MCSKKRFLFILFTALIFIRPSVFFAQQQELKSDEGNIDSVTFHKVLLIPYDQRYYLSDADQDIVLQTKKDPVEIRARFQKTLDLFIQRVLGGHLQCISLLNDTNVNAQSGLEEIYSNTGYSYEAPVQKSGQNSNHLVKARTSDDLSDSKTAYQYIQPPRENRYMAAIVNKKEIFENLFAEYGTDIFVFINQFEIKTNYASCLDIANKIYQRELKVHFTVYDKEGNIIAGNYAISFFPSNSSHADDIIHTCFPEVAGFVKTSVLN